MTDFPLQPPTRLVVDLNEEQHAFVMAGVKDKTTLTKNKTGERFIITTEAEEIEPGVWRHTVQRVTQ